jgi:hypothetical protein
MATKSSCGNHPKADEPALTPASASDPVAIPKPLIFRGFFFLPEAQAHMNTRHQSRAPAAGSAAAIHDRCS